MARREYETGWRKMFRPQEKFMPVDVQWSQLRRALIAVLAVSALGAGPAIWAQTSPAATAAQQNARAVSSYGQLPLRFEVNQGQSDSAVKFLSRGNDYSLYLTAEGASLALHKRISATQAETNVVQMKLAGGAGNIEPQGFDPLPGVSNYLIGNNPAAWHTRVPSFARVRYNAVYPGVDLVYYGKQQQLEYDFVVAPHADPNSIRLQFAGAKALNLDSRGNLVISAEDGNIVLNRPVIYQNERRHGRTARKLVSGQFALLANNSVGFAVGKYDRAQSLTIDPTLVYSTYLGGSNEDSVNAIAIDSSGAAYLTGPTQSADYPVTPGVFRTTYSSAFITKLNASGTALVYSSFLGGSGGPSGGDDGLGVAVDASGDAFVVGSTYSTNFPVTSGAYQITNKAAPMSGATGFAVKVNPAGTALLYGTYLGGTLTDNATSVAIDSSGDAYIAGFAYSSNFPTTTGAYQTTNKSAADYGWNQFVTKLNPAGSSLLYSTYIGGSGDYGSGGNSYVAIDSSGEAYICGIALSTDFPTTTGAFQKTTGAGAGHSNITLAKLNSAATSLLYSTYFGGSGSSYGDDAPGGLVIDSTGNAYFSGTTHETNLPVTSSAYLKTSASAAQSLPSAFVTKMNPTGTALVYSTYLSGSGGQHGDRGTGLAIDSSGDVYVTGSAGSTDFPVTSNAYQSTNAAEGNYGSVVFLTEFNPAGTALLYSTYFGGTASFSDSGNAIALGSGGAVYIAGNTGASNFPTTAGAYKTTYSSTFGSTGFVAEFGLGSAPATTSTTTTLTSTANPGITGNNLTFSASVVPSKGTGIPTGNVVFSVDEVTAATVALNSQGWAAYTTSTPLALGSHAILATYQGNSTYSSSGGNLTESIVPLTPTMTPAGGVYSSALLVTLADATPSAAIYYTTDGSTPSSSSSKYSAPVLVSNPETISAIAILPSSTSSIIRESYSMVNAPTVLAVPASAVSTPNATLHALINAYGMTGSYHFAYGVSSTALTNYTATTALPSSALGSRIGFAPVQVSTTVGGLTAKTTYYYQVVVVTPAGSSVGTILSFTTN
jgi:hypothetical protein